jgi:aquaporin Z
MCKVKNMNHALNAFREHWPEYLMEAWGLGLFMSAAGGVWTLLVYAGSPVAQAVTDPMLRLALMGAAMGLTSMGIIYSPWGKQSGAHVNPAVTLVFLRLGKISRWDAFFYILFQFAGGLLGMALVYFVLGEKLASPPVSFVVTVPGRNGAPVAFLAEFIISFLLMLTILLTTNSARLARLTGVFAGVLVAVYIAVEAPFSGMSMNPARTVATALPAGVWTDIWIYFTAPVVGMQLAISAYRLVARLITKKEPAVICAKLNHHTHRRCIFKGCGYGACQTHTF